MPFNVSDAYTSWIACYYEFERLRYSANSAEGMTQEEYIRLSRLAFEWNVVASRLTYWDKRALNNSDYPPERHRYALDYVKKVKVPTKKGGVLSEIANMPLRGNYPMDLPGLESHLPKDWAVTKNRRINPASPKYSERAFSGTDVEIYIISPMTEEFSNKAVQTQAALLGAGNLPDPLGMFGPDMGLVGDALLQNQAAAAQTIPPLMLPLIQAMAFEYSSFRAKPMARPLGFVNPSGFGKATRSIAGTFTTALMQSDVFHHILNLLSSAGHTAAEEAYYCLDLLPPVDAIITFANEYGTSCFRMVHGMEFISEDGSISINTPVVMATLQFVAKDSTPVIPLSDAALGEETKEQTLVRMIDSDFFKRITGTTKSDLKYEDIFKKDFASAFDTLYWRY